MPIVTATFFDDSGIETTQDAPEVHTVKYTVELPMAISRASVETIMIVPVSSDSTIEIVYPAEKQLSSPPLSGTFFATCYNTDGNRYDT